MGISTDLDIRRTLGHCHLIVVIVSCLPVPFYLNQAYAIYELKPPGTGTCSANRPNQAPSALLDCVDDTILLLLPFPVLWRLQMNLRRKLEITAGFRLEVFVLMASLIRLRFIWLARNRAIQPIKVPKH
ncbi:hypothetical protein N7G274_002857 [Stereocaulon virgatum]|uniref:Rhodopsin domain-containing protein n=1 Tax=Stereocaulon virgatum TaxID=373712 RepID=A0ABR4AH23_9LECA